MVTHRYAHRLLFAAVLAIQLLILAPAWACGSPDTCSRKNPASEVSIGVRAGINFAQHAGTEERDSEYEVASAWRPGFTGGLLVYWPITPRFGLQQEVVYTQKGSSQTIDVEILDVPTSLDVTYEMDYIELPILMRFDSVRWRSGSVYSLTGTALSLKISDHYRLEGTLSDAEQVVPLTADAGMSEVDMFDFSFVYGLGYERSVRGYHLMFEYRFTMGWNTLHMPTYAHVPFGEDDEVLIENEPVPLKNQSHCITLGIRF
ncbi:MAG: PorT family protein [Candidatus Eisenbacteria bacterium]|nr:PorT family protein [Candidatus Eisenbacteria bacterium]